MAIFKSDSLRTYLENHYPSGAINNSGRYSYVSMDSVIVSDAVGWEGLTPSALEASDTEVLLNIVIPSNSIIHNISLYNTDLDSNASPTLEAQLETYATENFSYVSSSDGQTYKALKDSRLDTQISSLTAPFINFRNNAPFFEDIQFEPTAFPPSKAGKGYWDIIGMEKNPPTFFRVGLRFTTPAATAQPGSFVVKIEFCGFA